MRALVWFRGKDLRLADHEPLLVPLFVVDPYFFAKVRARELPNRMQFLVDSLTELAEGIAARGSQLSFLEGKSVERVPAFARACRVDRVVAYRWSEPVGIERDRRVAAALAESGVRFELFEGETMAAPGQVLLVAVVGPARGDPSLKYYDEDAEFPDQMASAVSNLSLGRAHTCIAIGETIKCWGMNDHWQLGTEHKNDPSDPMNQNPSVHQTVKLRASSAGAGANPPAMAAGDGHQCAMSLAGTVQCWGANDLGQLGDGTTKQRAQPAEASGVTDAIAIAAGANHTCVLTKDDAVWCWGDGSQGQLGDGKTSNDPPHAKPQRVNWSTAAPTRVIDPQLPSAQPPSKIPTCARNETLVREDGPPRLQGGVQD